jgi:hypothetical protein
MKFEPDTWSRLDVPHAGEEQGRQQLLIRQAAPDAGNGFVDELLPGRVFDEPHQRLNLGAKLHNVSLELHFLGRESRELRGELQIRKTQQGTSTNGLKKLTA